MVGGKRTRNFDDDDGYRDFRPRMPKRQRVPPVVQLCKEMMPDIRTLGETVKAFEEDIKFLSEAIANEFGNEEYFRNALLSTLYAVVVEQPHKQPAIALLTMVVNSMNPVAGKSVLNHFFGKLQEWCDISIDESFQVTSSETGPWNKVKLLLRFLSLLSPMVEEDELLLLYKKLFELSVGLNNLNPEKRNPLSEAIYSNTLLNIPYLFFFSKENERLRGKVADLVSEVESTYLVKNTDLSLIREYNKNPPYESVQWVKAVLPNVKRVLANDMQQISELFPDYTTMMKDQPGDQGFNDPLNLPTIEQLEPFSGLDRGLGSIDGMWKVPRYSFRVYLANEVGEFETVVPFTTYAGMLFEDLIIDIIESMEFNRKEVAKQVVTLDLFFKPGIFAEPGQSIAQLIALHEENPIITTYKIEDLAIEKILSMIFKLPNVSHPFAYFYTLLVEICQNSPKAIAPVFGRAFRYFFNNLDELDLELKLRYLDWFSIQMSNFSFSWKWNEWEDESIKFSKTFYSPKVTFMRNLIRKELRLTSSKSDVEDSLTEEFKPYTDSSFVPKSDLINYYQSFFKDFEIDIDLLKDNDLFFIQPCFPFNETVQNVINYFHKQPLERSSSELMTIFEELQNNHGNIIHDINRLVVTILMQSLAFSGNRSLSHANKYIGDSRNDLLDIMGKMEVDQELKERWIIEAVIRYWNSNSQNGYLILDTCKNFELISAKSILNFSFLEDNDRNWGLVDATSVESTFRTLTELSLRRDASVETFLYVFERLVEIASETVEKLGVASDVAVVVPKDSTAIRELELSWKYESCLGFIKSILRKYADEYTPGLEQLNSILDGKVAHERTRQTIQNWLRELKEL
ncbi:LANO_0H02586g1_1 [Lachancea nothofagi CBS 11611]|uniref:Nuclear cap-binding protein complex subunit 1 n=1 Tax=Lachancea nothofagi CBS 11611 TaxID=1266666 RepID=A0A1G4KL50_9SACH|nr:LANO_0H02586g1_1 [Lachancea nothofagi CBS 11611]